MLIETEQEMLNNTNSARQRYLDGLYAVLGRRRAEYDSLRREYITPESAASDRERYRADLASLIGWPLTEFEELDRIPMDMKKTFRYDTGYAKAYAMEFEVLPDLWFYTLYFEKDGNTDRPFIIAQHGGCGNPESGAETFETNNYNGMVRRLSGYGDGSNVLCPMLLMWPDRFHPGPRDTEDEGYNRPRVDARFKQVGSSLTAIEIFAIKRILGYFIDMGIARPGHIGMTGLSYGGFYTTMTAALDTRITAAFSSAQFSDRYRYGREDWIWRDDTAALFLDAEVASLIAPRPFFAEAGEVDDLFDVKAFISECKRTEPFFRAAGVPENFRYRTHEGTHEYGMDDEGIAFLYDHIR